MTLFSGQTGPIAHVSRILGAAAQVSEAAGEAASSAVMRGTEFSTAVSTAFIDITATSYGAMQTAWHGVDLVDLAVHKVSGSVTADSPERIASWLNSTNGRNLTNTADEFVLETWQRLLQDLSPSMPHLSRSSDKLVLAGMFTLVAGEVHIVTTGHALFFYEVSTVKFQPRWANPLWSLLELSHDTEHHQVLTILQQVLKEAPVPNRTRTQLGPALSVTAYWRLLLGRTWWALRLHDWSESFEQLWKDGNLWGIGVFFAGWALARSGPIAQTLPEDTAVPGQNLEPAAEGGDGTSAFEGNSEANLSAIQSEASSTNTTGLFEVVGSSS
jgi:hypothetical protein